MATANERQPTVLENIERAFYGLNTKLEKSVQEHLSNVYSTVGVGLGAAAVGAAVHLFTNIFRANFLFTLISFGLMFVLMGTPDTRENRNKRFGYFIGFCALNGVGMGPLLEAVIQIDPSIVLTALLATAVVFGCFSFAALWADSTKFLHLGGTLSSAILCLLLGSFFFSHSIILWGGLAIACLFVLYDTQMIAEKSRRGDNDYIWHAVELFIDFANIFRHLLVLLADKKADENDRRKKRN